MIDIIPSILVQDKQEFLSQLGALRHSVTHVQLDIADGQFVPNTTWAEPRIVQEITGYTFELHLMVEDPLTVIQHWADVPNVTRLIIHAESVTNIPEAVKQARNYHKEVFVGLKIETPLTLIDEVVGTIDGVLFMGVHPGFQGQKLIPQVLEKIIECRKKYRELYTELDGGVAEDTLEAIAATGVHAICPGSLVFRRLATPEEQIASITQQLT